MLRTEALHSGYGKLKVLYNVNFEAKSEKITAIVGPNGAGKTTLLNSITGLATIHSGRVYFRDTDITGKPSHKVSRMGISYVPQMGNVFSNLTVEENLRIAGYQLSEEKLKDKMELVYSMFPALSEFRNRKAGTLSGGERRMLAIGMALVREPKVIMLDEVSMDLAPIFVKKVFEKVVELKDDLKLTVILVEQYALRALEVADKAYLLVSGTVRFEGEPQELLKQQLARLYLGVS